VSDSLEQVTDGSGPNVKFLTVIGLSSRTVGTTP
jgi:hypothetical protein